MKGPRYRYCVQCRASCPGHCAACGCRHDVTAKCTAAHAPDEYEAMGKVVEVTEMALRVLLLVKQNQSPVGGDGDVSQQLAVEKNYSGVSVWIPRTLMRACPRNEVHDYPDQGKLVLPAQFARARYFPGTLEQKKSA